MNERGVYMTGAVYNDVVWKDTDGEDIYCQGGCVSRFGSLYYWYGMEVHGDSLFYGIRCYTSPDLMNWTYRGYVLTAGQCKELSSRSWIGRPTVLKNPNTGKYVMVFEYSNGRLGVIRNRLAFAEGDRPYGENFSYKGCIPIENCSVGDQGAFQLGDDAYIAVTYDTALGSRDKSTYNKKIGIFRLDPSHYLGIHSKVYGADNTPGIEAHHIFERDGYYYWFGSKLWGWNSSPTQYAVSKSLTGPWAFQDLSTNPPSGDSYNTQHDFVITVTGSDTSTYIYCGDRWSMFTGVGASRNVWLPLSWEGKVPTLKYTSSWDICIHTGEVCLR